MEGWAGFLVAAAIGGIVGWVEMAQRYSDAPSHVLLWPAAWLYIGANIAASLAALGLVRSLHWTFGQTDPTSRATIQVLVAGFGAMALFRSRLFTAAQPIATGSEVKFLWSPATLLEGMLKIADREARKTQGRSRLRAARTVSKLTWADVRKLPPIVLALMESDEFDTRAQEQAAEFARDVKACEKNPEGYSDDQRKLMLGVRIVRFAGARVLREAIAYLRHK
jgi:hypothetical protein